MSDKKTDIDTDFEEKWADIANRKWRTRTNNDIYNRFITRVQSIEGDCHADNDTQARLDLIATETADTETVFDFSNQSAFVEGMFDTDELLEMDSNDSQLDSDHNSIMDSETDVLSDPEANTYDDWDTQEAQIDDMVSEPAATQKLASSKKPLITGMVFGSLLIAVIVAALIFTGILSTTTNTAVPDSANSTPNSNIEAIETEVTINNIPAEEIGSETSIDETELSTVDTPVADSQQGEATSESQGSTPNVAKVTEAPLSEAASDESQADNAISYEVFRQESQSTLYRETND